MSNDDTIKALDDHYYKGTLTFDQFVLGATLAAAGYLAQTGSYSIVGWNRETLTLIPLALLGIASWLGFKRVELTILVLKRNVNYLEARRKRPTHDHSSVLKEVQRIAARTSHVYRWRNWAIASGLVSHVCLQILFKYPIF